MISINNKKLDFGIFDLWAFRGYLAPEMCYLVLKLIINPLVKNVAISEMKTDVYRLCWREITFTHLFSRVSKAVIWLLFPAVSYIVSSASSPLVSSLIFMMVMMSWFVLCAFNVNRRGDAISWKKESGRKHRWKSRHLSSYDVWANRRLETFRPERESNSDSKEHNDHMSIV